MHLGKTLSSQDLSHTVAHYNVDMYDTQVQLISREAEVHKQEKHLIANDSISEQLSFPFLQNKQAMVFQTAAADP